MDTGKPKLFRPTVVALEAREVPAIASIQLANSVLTIQTTDIASNISIVQNPFTVAVRDSETSKVWNYSRSQVGIVNVFGGAGNDSFTSQGNAGVAVGLYGKGGDDTLNGDAGPNTLIGGPGNDRLYGRGGNDHINGGAGNDFIFGGIGDDILNGNDGDDTVIGGQGADAITGNAGDDVLVSIDGTNRDTVDAGSGIDTAWVDQIGGIQEAVTGLDGADFIRPVAAFANAAGGADLSLTGDRIKNPALLFSSDSYETFADRPMFSAAGPSINDINQSLLFGDTPVLDDSWLLGSVGAMVQDYPFLIKSNVVDFGDGTYGVRFNGTFYRVDNELPVFLEGNVTPAYAGVGADNSLWVAIIEKAVATATSTTDPSYTLIDGVGTPTTAFTLFGASAKAITNLNTPGVLVDSSQLGTVLNNVITKNFPTVYTVTDSAGTTLVDGQTYTVVSLQYDSINQVSAVVMRNPTGIDGGFSFDNDPNDGYVTISIDDLFSTTGTLTFVDFSKV